MSELDFEQRVARALRAPVPTNARAKAAIMATIRRAALEEMPRRRMSLPLGRNARHSLIGLALAAGIGSITTLSALTTVVRSHRATSGVVTSEVIGDSVVDRVRDTLRLVRLMFDDSAARQVAVVGDFNGWRGDASPMERDARSGRWSVTLALHDGEHRYAVVVDNTRWVGATAGRAGEASGRVSSILHVARATN